jgi:hypothetical protein
MQKLDRRSFLRASAAFWQHWVRLPGTPPANTSTAGCTSAWTGGAAPACPTPRHGLGAAAVGNAIHMAGGDPVMGGSVQSAMHEALTLAL